MRQCPIGYHATRRDNCLPFSIKPIDRIGFGPQVITAEPDRRSAAHRAAAEIIIFVHFKIGFPGRDLLGMSGLQCLHHDAVSRDRLDGSVALVLVHDLHLPLEDVA